MTDEYMIDLDEATTLSDTDEMLVTTDVDTIPASKFTKWETIKSVLKTYFDTLYTGFDIHTLTVKTTPVNNDELPIADSASSYVFKKILISTLKSEFMKSVYPVGSVVTFGVSTNPATLFGFGTWTAIAGKVIVGLDSSQTEFDTLNETGGSKTHTLTTAEIPAHTHAILTRSNYVSGETSVTRMVNATTSGGVASQGATGSNGSDGAHNNLQPYIVKYVWERTA